MKKKFIEEGDPVTYFGPTVDPPLGRSGRQTTILVRDIEYFMHTKFLQNPSSVSGGEVENVNCLTDEQTDRQTTDDGQRVITIGHWSFRLLCSKNGGIWRKRTIRIVTEQLLQSGTYFAQLCCHGGSTFLGI